MPVSGCLALIGLLFEIGSAAALLAQSRQTWQQADEAEARTLLISPATATQLLALEKLFAIDAKLWLQDPQVVARLRTLVSASSSDASVRKSILWLFRTAGQFSQVSDVAEKLVNDNSDPSLAREAARVLTYQEGGTAVSAGLQRMFLSGQGVLRQEAAIAIGRRPHPELEAGLKRAVISQLISDFQSSDNAPTVRGDALEASAGFVGDPEMQAALIGMLNPARWFFGAQGQHYPVSSLVPVVRSLGYSMSPAVTHQLHQLHERLSILPEDQRWDVEVALNFELRNR